MSSQCNKLCQSLRYQNRDFRELQDVRNEGHVRSTHCFSLHEEPRGAVMFLRNSWVSTRQGCKRCHVPALRCVGPTHIPTSRRSFIALDNDETLVDLTTGPSKLLLNASFRIINTFSVIVSPVRAGYRFIQAVARCCADEFRQPHSEPASDETQRNAGVLTALQFNSTACF
eukprot:6209595-Pleurochrysis_carterae.AAC.2